MPSTRVAAGVQYRTLHVGTVCAHCTRSIAKEEINREKESQMIATRQVGLRRELREGSALSSRSHAIACPVAASVAAAPDAPAVMSSDAEIPTLARLRDPRKVPAVDRPFCFRFAENRRQFCRAKLSRICRRNGFCFDVFLRLASPLSRSHSCRNACESGR